MFGTCFPWLIRKGLTVMIALSVCSRRVRRVVMLDIEVGNTVWVMLRWSKYDQNIIFKHAADVIMSCTYMRLYPVSFGADRAIYTSCLLEGHEVSTFT